MPPISQRIGFMPVKVFGKLASLGMEVMAFPEFGWNGGGMGRVSSIILSIALILVAAWSALIASAARADFVFRCPDIPKETWDMTTNCADGSFGQMLFGSLALVCLCAAGFIVLRAFVL